MYKSIFNHLKKKLKGGSQNIDIINNNITFSFNNDGDLNISADYSFIITINDHKYNYNYKFKDYNLIIVIEKNGISYNTSIDVNNTNDKHIGEIIVDKLFRLLNNFHNFSYKLSVFDKNTYKYLKIVTSNNEYDIPLAHNTQLIGSGNLTSGNSIGNTIDIPHNIFNLLNIYDRDERIIRYALTIAHIQILLGQHKEGHIRDALLTRQNMTIQHLVNSQLNADVILYMNITHISTIIATGFTMAISNAVIPELTISTITGLGVGLYTMIRLYNRRRQMLRLRDTIIHQSMTLFQQIRDGYIREPLYVKIFGHISVLNLDHYIGNPEVHPIPILEPVEPVPVPIPEVHPIPRPEFDFDDEYGIPTLEEEIARHEQHERIRERIAAHEARIIARRKSQEAAQEVAQEVAQEARASRSKTI